jgi:TatD DNase family protein
MWIDCHAHCDRLPGSQIDDIIAEAAHAGVSMILSTATDLCSAGSVSRQCRTYPSIYGAVGISPFEALSVPEDWEERLCSSLDDKRIVAIGEIGLDRTSPKYPSLEHQIPLFTRQLTVALKRNLPVVLHSRGAERQTAEICRSAGIQKAVFHCFTGDKDSLRYILESGYHVSFSGIITFDSTVAERVRDVPLNRIFVETDSPYLAPVPYRGKTNRPAFVALVGDAAARCKGIASDRLQIEIEKNFRRLFLPT